MYRSSIKRLIDFITSLLAFFLLMPVIGVLILVIAIANSGNPFFFQKRIGFNNKLFKIVKFKSMNDKKDKEGNLLSDSERLTPIGRFVRKTSLDELPQLINVIKGDMSLIGPRPLLPEYLPLYNSFQKRRHEVRPGITGWAQINGRNAISWTQKFELDVWYVDHISISLDIKIFWMTISKVFKSEGISSTTSATMEKFEGNK